MPRLASCVLLGLSLMSATAHADPLVIAHDPPPPVASSGSQRPGNWYVARAWWTNELDTFAGIFQLGIVENRADESYSLLNVAGGSQVDDEN